MWAYPAQWRSTSNSRLNWQIFSGFHWCGRACTLCSLWSKLIQSQSWRKGGQRDRSMPMIIPGNMVQNIWKSTGSMPSDFTSCSVPDTNTITSHHICVNWLIMGWFSWKTSQYPLCVFKQRLVSMPITYTVHFTMLTPHGMVEREIVILCCQPWRPAGAVCVMMLFLRVVNPHLTLKTCLHSIRLPSPYKVYGMASWPGVACSWVVLVCILRTLKREQKSE